MIAFPSPEMQYDLIREQNDELVREAAEYRRARDAADRPARRFGRWPRTRRTAVPNKPARQSLAS
jgi:hypothetical protein